MRFTKNAGPNATAKPPSKGPPKQRFVEVRVHRTGNGEHHRVVDYLHDTDRHRVGGQGNRHDRHQREPERSNGSEVSV